MDVLRLELLLLVLSCLAFQFGDCIKCIQCRSDENPACGNLQISAGGRQAKSVNCDEYNTQKTLSCYKAVQHVAGTYKTVRGCAPFNVRTVPAFMQHAMAGTFWKGGDSFSLCASDDCNSSTSLQVSGLLVAAAILFLSKVF